MTIYLYTGNGAGKTTNALGIALRALGHDKYVLMIQFLKWKKETGEYQFQWKTIDSWIPNHFECHQFGREGWIGFNNLTIEDSIKTKEGLLFAHDLLNGLKGEKHFDILILDEINLAVHLGLLTMMEVKTFLTCIPKHIDIVMTGRSAPQELMDIADIVNEINEIKSPKDMINKEGIQY
jgi:cob(I)alamin adenosyltransferase